MRYFTWFNKNSYFLKLLASLILIVFIFSAGKEFISVKGDGDIPNINFPSSDIGKFISPNMAAKHHCQPIIFNGYAVLTGNASHEVFDISNPRAPVFKKTFTSEYTRGEAESHQVTMGRDNTGNYYMATTSGKGFDIWDMTNTLNPTYVKAVTLPNINYGDVNNGVWGLSWQGNYIYVGATNNGIYIVDVSDVNNPVLVKTVPTSQFSGIKAGPLFAMGSLLIVTTPKDANGIATLDISNPTSPILLDFVKPSGTTSYIGGYYGKYATLINPIRVYDVTTDPSNIKLIGTKSNPLANYVTFDENRLFLGGVKVGVNGSNIYDVSDFKNIKHLSYIKGRTGRDDSFSCPVGNLLILSDDERTGGRHVGSVITVHKEKRDTKGPTVMYTNPVDKQEKVATTASIGISFSDWIEFKSVSELGLIVRPAGGGLPLKGKWGWLYTTVTFTPDLPFDRKTEYEVILPENQITDLVGNSMSSSYRFTFNTDNGGLPEYDSPKVSGYNPASLGSNINWAIQNPSNDVVYEWTLEGNIIGEGTSITPQINETGRYNACIKVLQKGGSSENLIYEAEKAIRSGGVFISNTVAGFSGSGYVDFPNSQGNNVFVEWRVNSDISSETNLIIKYANGGSNRPLNLVVNNGNPISVPFPSTGGFTNYNDIEIKSVSLKQGENSIKLIANNGSVGPNIDYLKIPLQSSKVIKEAELAQANGNVTVSTVNTGYSGSGYMDFPNTQGNNVKLEWVIPKSTGIKTPLKFRYSNGDTEVRSLSLTINDQAPITLNFSTTGNWNTWAEITTEPLDLIPGNNRIILTANTGTAGPKIDYLELAENSNSGRLLETLCFVQTIYKNNTSPSKSSSTMILDGNTLWNVNPDNNSITAINTLNNTKTMEIPVGKFPKSLTKAGDNIWVINEKEATISVINKNNGTIIKTITLPNASQPSSILSSQNENFIYVSLSALGEVIKIKASDFSIAETLSLNKGKPENAPKLSGMALNGANTVLLVNRFISNNNQGEVFQINPNNMSLTKTIKLLSTVAKDESSMSRGIPNYLKTIAINPENNEAWVASKKDNIERGKYRDGLILDHQTTVRAITSRIKLNTMIEDLSSRIDIDNSDRCEAIVFSNKFGLAFVSLAGNNRVAVIDTKSGNVISSFDTQKIPDALVLDNTDNFIYAHNFLSRSVSIFNIEDLNKGIGNALKIADVSTVSSETLNANVLLGKQIFYDASSIKINQNGYMACASCHLDGAQDGQTWDFTSLGEGFRNTIDLRGRSGTAHGRLHWTANFDEIHDFENQIRFFGAGTGFMSDADFSRTEATLGTYKSGLSKELDALNSYLVSLNRVPDSPYRSSNGMLTSNGIKGKKAFKDYQCYSCHATDAFTDSFKGKLHDIGSIKESSGTRLGSTLTGIDTPTLKGIWNTAPYLHDGSAATIKDAIIAHTNINVAQNDIDNLVEYLLQIDENETNDPLSVNNVAHHSFKVHPNPARVSVTITNNLNQKNINQGIAKFLDINGRTVKTFSLEKATTHTINIEDLNAGIYFINITYSNKKEIIKIIKI